MIAYEDFMAFSVVERGVSSIKIFVEGKRDLVNTMTMSGVHSTSTDNEILEGAWEIYEALNEDGFSEMIQQSVEHEDRVHLDKLLSRSSSHKFLTVETTFDEAEAKCQYFKEKVDLTYEEWLRIKKMMALELEMKMIELAGE